MKVFERLRKRLMVECPELGVTAETEFVRNYYGYWQKSAGAWSWTGINAFHSFGSLETASDLVRADALETSFEPFSQSLEVWSSNKKKD